MPKTVFVPTKEVTMEDVIHPIELHYQRSIPEMVLDWTKELVRYLQDDYDSESYDPGGRYNFKMELGRKYWKIHDGNGVHAFVDRNTGEVYKPASWKSPAKIVRYDLRLISDRAKLHDPKFTDWAGGYLYLR